MMLCSIVSRFLEGNNSADMAKIISLVESEKIAEDKMADILEMISCEMMGPNFMIL